METLFKINEIKVSEKTYNECAECLKELNKKFSAVEITHHYRQEEGGKEVEHCVVERRIDVYNHYLKYITLILMADKTSQ